VLPYILPKLDDEFICVYAIDSIAQHIPLGVEKIRIEEGIINLEGIELSETKYQLTTD
jgi:hypothetical protein